MDPAVHPCWITTVLLEAWTASLAGVPGTLNMAQQTSQDIDSDLLMWLQDERGHLDQTGASANTEEGFVVGKDNPGLSHGIYTIICQGKNREPFL